MIKYSSVCPQHQPSWYQLQPSWYVTRRVAAVVWCADSVITLSRLLTLCILHHAAEVRRAAAAGCQQVLCAEPCLFGSLLSALRHWANHSHEAAVLVVSGKQEGQLVLLTRSGSHMQPAGMVLTGVQQVTNVISLK